MNEHTEQKNTHPGMNSRVSWDDLSDFLAVAQAGGLAAAAKRVSSSAPTLGRKMRALERAMDRELFVRRTHGYDLTEAGVELLRELEAVAGQIARATVRPTNADQPLVKVSAGTWTSFELSRRWRDVVGDPQDTRLRLLSSEAVLSLTRRQASIAIRNKRPQELGLAGRKLARNDFAVYAAPNAPLHWIVHNVDTPSSRWTKEHAGMDCCFEVSDPRLALDLAIAGAGQVVLPTFIGDQQPTLERRSEKISRLSHDAWLVVHDDDRHLPEIRRIMDRILALRS